MSNTVAVNMWLTREFKSTKDGIDSRESPVEGSGLYDQSILSSTRHGSAWSHMLKKHTRGDRGMTRAMARWLLADLIPILVSTFFRVGWTKVSLDNSINWSLNSTFVHKAVTS
jgi:hypothetical protein